MVTPFFRCILSLATLAVLIHSDGAYAQVTTASMSFTPPLTSVPIAPNNKLAQGLQAAACANGVCNGAGKTASVNISNTSTTRLIGNSSRTQVGTAK